MRTWDASDDRWGRLLRPPASPCSAPATSRSIVRLPDLKVRLARVSGADFGQPGLLRSVRDVERVLAGAQQPQDHAGHVAGIVRHHAGPGRGPALEDAVPELGRGD